MAWFDLIWHATITYIWRIQHLLCTVPYKNRSVHSKSVYTQRNWINLCCSPFMTLVLFLLLGMLHDGGWDPCVRQASKESGARAATTTQKTSLCGTGRNCRERSQENRHGPVGSSGYLWMNVLRFLDSLPACCSFDAAFLMACDQKGRGLPWRILEIFHPESPNFWMAGVLHTPGIENSLALSHALGLPLLPSWSSTLLCYYAGVWICDPKTDGCGWMFESMAFGSQNRFIQSVPRPMLVWSALSLSLSLSLSSLCEILSDVSRLQLKSHGHDICCCMLLLFFWSFCERVTVRASFKCHY